MADPGWVEHENSTWLLEYECDGLTATGRVTMQAGKWIAVGSVIKRGDPTHTGAAMRGSFGDWDEATSQVSAWLQKTCEKLTRKT